MRPHAGQAPKTVALSVLRYATRFLFRDLLMPDFDNSPPPQDNRLIAHSMSDTVTDSALREAAAARIRAAGDLPGASVDRQFALLDELSQTELGRFLLRHRGLDAIWTHRLVSHEPGSDTAVGLTGIEKDL